MCNVVIFGPTHSGKSTLMGYMDTYEYSDEKFDREMQKIRSQIENDGEKYKADMRYAYVVDTGKDERRLYNKKEKSIGGSKRLHIKSSKIDIDCSFIDTPGSDITWKDRYEGVFLGDIGIYLIEIMDLIKLANKVEDSRSYKNVASRIFSPIFLWKHYKNTQKLIIAISKIDMERYSAYAISGAINVIRSVKEFGNITIVPISIDVNSRVSHNIFDKSDATEWYKGPTLIDCLKSIIERAESSKIGEAPLLAHIDKIFCKTKQGPPAIRIKMLSGKITNRDIVCIGPLQEDSTNENLILTGEVSSLKQEDSNSIVASLEVGKIGGIMFSKLYQNRTNYKLTDFKLKRTGLLFGSNCSIRVGNLLFMTIQLNSLNKTTKKCISEIRPNDRVNLIWFGKVISMHVIGRVLMSNKCNLIVTNISTASSMFLLPLTESNEFVYNRFVIQLPNNYYVETELTDMEDLTETALCKSQFSFNKEMYPFTEPYQMPKECTTIVQKQIITDLTNENHVTITFEDVDMRNIVNSMTLMNRFIKKNNITAYNFEIEISKDRI